MVLYGTHCLSILCSNTKILGLSYISSFSVRQLKSVLSCPWSWSWQSLWFNMEIDLSNFPYLDGLQPLPPCDRLHTHAKILPRLFSRFSARPQCLDHLISNCTDLPLQLLFLFSLDPFTFFPGRYLILKAVRSVSFIYCLFLSLTAQILKHTLKNSKTN